MRKVDRSKVDEPAILTTKWGREDKNEFERNLDLLTAPVAGKKMAFKRYKEKAVKDALEDLFHGKCAYCESYFSQTQPVDVEHYRPKGRVAKTEHSGYWWLAADWENLLPSCIDCNRRRKQSLPMTREHLDALGDGWTADVATGKVQSMGKADVFPLLSGSARAGFDVGTSLATLDLKEEKRLLLDPTRDDPSETIWFNAGIGDEYSFVLAKLDDSEDKNGVPHKDKAIASIRTYGLNRLGLVQARTQHLRSLEFLLEMYLSLEDLKGQAGGEKALNKAELDDVMAQVDTPERAELVKTYQRRGVFLSSIDNKMGALQDSIIARFAKLARPEAPFSALVQAWLDENIDTNHVT